jgi:hypothetical protein
MKLKTDATALRVSKRIWIVINPLLSLSYKFAYSINFITPYNLNKAKAVTIVFKMLCAHSINLIASHFLTIFLNAST